MAAATTTSTTTSTTTTNTTYNTQDDIRSAMTEAVELDGQLRQRFNATVALIVDGQEEWYLDARAAKPQSNDHKQQQQRHAPPPPQLTVTLSSAVLHDLLAQKLTPQQAFVQKKLQIKGKMTLALKLKLILDATRKQLSNSTARL